LRYAGFGPVVFTMLTGFILADWFFIPPRHSLLLTDRVDQVITAFYFLISFVVMFLSQRTRQALGRERAMRDEFQRQAADLRTALANVKTLSGLLPICSHCKKIRDDNGYWNQIEKFIRERSNANFSHGVCPDCAKKHYPDLFPDNEVREISSANS
jgi:hypothetical protein